MIRLAPALVALVVSPAAIAQGIWSTAQLSQARSRAAAASVNERVLVGGGLAGTGPSAVVDVYHAPTGGWSTAQLSAARYGLSAVSVAGKVLFAGGVSATGFSGVVDIYDDSTGTWSTATLSVPRERPVALAHGSTAIFAGGHVGGFNGSNVIDIYDAVTGTWSTGSMGQPRKDHSGVVVGTQALLASGTQDGGTYLTTSEAFDFVASAVTPVPASLLGRYDMGAASHDGVAYFAGGTQPGSLTDLVEIYDSATGTWTTAHLSVARRGLSGGVVGDEVLFAGGVWSDVVDVLDTTNGTWSTTQLSSARAYMAAARASDGCGDELLFAGGLGQGGASADVDLYLGQPSHGDLPEYGSGCAGGGGLVPRLRGCGSTSAGGSFTLELEDVAPASTALFLLGIFEAAIPAAGPCSLLVAPVLPVVPSFPTGGTTGHPGSGAVVLPVTIPSGTLPGTVRMQAFVGDGANAWGYSASNGVTVTIQ